MAVRKLSVLKMERDSLLERWNERKAAERAKILVQLIDIDEDIDRMSKEEQESNLRKINYIS